MEGKGSIGGREGKGGRGRGVKGINRREDKRAEMRGEMVGRGERGAVIGKNEGKESGVVSCGKMDMGKKT